MNDPPTPHRDQPGHPADPPARFARQVDIRARRKIRARQHREPGVWFGLGMMGLIGWSIVVPTLAGTAIGMWLDHRFPRGESWTLMLLVAGLVIGCFNAWMWMSKEDQAMHHDKDDAKDNSKDKSNNE